MHLAGRNMRTLVRLTTLMALGVACLVAMMGGAYPKPAPVPIRWELEFTSGPLRLYFDRDEGEYYWYFTYTVVNRTDDKQVWAPTFILFTDMGDILPSGRDVPSHVTHDIMEMLRNKFLEDQNQIIGDILQGRENAKEGVVIWPVVHTSVNEMSLFISGISGESARVENPATGAQVVVRKTLQRDYLVPGDALARGSEPANLVSEQWVLR